MKIPGRFILQVLLGIVSIGIIAHIFSITIASYYPGSSNVVGPSADDQALMQKISVEYGTKHQITPSAYSFARRIARKQPLASGPFAIIALEALEKGQTQRAVALLEAGRQRNPRERFGRIILLEQYARSGSYTKAAEELSAFYRLTPDAGKALIDTMTAMATDQQGFAPLARAVRNETTLGPLLSNLVTTGAPIDRILLLGRNTSKSIDPEQTAWRKLLLQRLVDEGNYTFARRLWADFSKVSAAAKMQYYNFALAKSPALAPFNWEMPQENIGSVDLIGSGTASVAYFGRESGVLMSQLLTLSPGEYQFRYATEGGRGSSEDSVAWHVRCAVADNQAGASVLLGTSPVHGDSAGKHLNVLSFTVPAKCDAQWLTLDGTSAEFPTPQTIEISELKLARKDR